MVPIESSRRDLQSGTGPRAPGAQKKYGKYEIHSPNSACTMGFWRSLRAGKWYRAAGDFASTQNQQYPSGILAFSKKWSWRSSFEVPRVKIRRILQLICLFLVQHAFGSLGVPWELLGSPWQRFGTALGLPWGTWERLGPPPGLQKCVLRSFTAFKNTR